MRPLNPPITEWKGQRVWIIGASSGIGAALARQLQQRGARLALSARRELPLRKLGRERDLVLPLDVSDSDRLFSAQQQISKEWGGIDLLIYCAGVYQPMGSDRIESAVAQEMITTNLLGAYAPLQAVLPDMLEHGKGGIALVASVAGYTGLPQALAYGPAKAGLINLAQTLYTELSRKGIGLYLINPGFVDTRLTQKNRFKMPAMITPEEAALEVIAGIGKGRFEIHFPRRFTRLMRWLALLPDRPRFFLLKKAVSG